MEENKITGFILITMGSMLLMALGLIFLFRVSKKQLVKQFEEKEQLKERHQQELLEAAIETQEREREQIAAELHDHIGSNLQALKLFLHQLSDGNNLPLALQSTDLLAQTIQDVKDLSHELMPASLVDLGLAEALSTLCSRLDATGQMACELNCKGTGRLDARTELALYRIVQELTSNTLQHARADRIRIGLEISETGFDLEYQDNGIGPQAHSKHTGRGLGMKNMESRCQMIGATLEPVFESHQPGFGLRITKRTRQT